MHFHQGEGPWLWNIRGSWLPHPGSSLSKPLSQTEYLVRAPWLLCLEMTRGISSNLRVRNNLVRFRKYKIPKTHNSHRLFIPKCNWESGMEQKPCNKTIWLSQWIKRVEMIQQFIFKLDYVLCFTLNCNFEIWATRAQFNFSRFLASKETNEHFFSMSDESWNCLWT